MAGTLTVCRSGGIDPVPRFLIGTSNGDPAREGTRPYTLPYGGQTEQSRRFDFHVIHEGTGSKVVDLQPTASSRSRCPSRWSRGTPTNAGTATACGWP